MTKAVKVGDVTIGGGNKITVQSMTNTPTLDEIKTKAQISRLIEAGCDIIRLAVCSDEEVEMCKKYIAFCSVPLVADIQFDYKLAVRCSDIGFCKVRINPGNIGSEKGVRELVAACKANGTPIRIGVNGGSLQSGLSSSGAEALAESALKNVAMLERLGFYDVIISVKSSDVSTMVKANTVISKKCDYPLHLGVTESGDAMDGTIKSAIGIGSLLLGSIGDTVRVSLSDDPVSEVYAARRILRSIGLDKNYCEVISCPTCSRCNYDLFSVVKQVKELVKDIKVPLKVAVMGCVVNGPGEAKDADCGVAGGGNGRAALFAGGKTIKTIPSDEIVPELSRLINISLEKKKVEFSSN